MTTYRHRWNALAGEATTAGQRRALVHGAVQADELDAELAGTASAEVWCEWAFNAYYEAVRRNLYTHLDARPATAVHAVALHTVAAAGTHGLMGHRIDGTARNTLVRWGWLASTTPTGWAAQLTLTADGAAALSAALSAPPILDEATVAALRQIADRPDGATPHWSAPGMAVQVADLFGLTDTQQTYGAGPQRWVTLTDAGRVALAAAAPAPAAPATAAQARLMQELADGHTLRRQHLYDEGTYAVCKRRGWISWTELDDDERTGSRWMCVLTDAGGVALAAVADRPARTPNKPRRLPVSRLEPGMVVRLANRGVWRGLGPQWVTVDHIAKIPTRGNLPGGYQVWAYSAGGAVVGYADGHPFYGGNRFEVRDGPR